MGKNENYVLYGIHCGLKVGLSIQIKELMKLNEYQRSRSLFDLAQRSSDFTIKTCFSQKMLGHLEPTFIQKLIREWE